MFQTSVPSELCTFALDMLDAALRTDLFTLGRHFSYPRSSRLSVWATQHLMILEAFHRCVTSEDYRKVREWYDSDTTKGYKHIERIMNRSAAGMVRIMGWRSLADVPDVEVP